MNQDQEVPEAFDIKTLHKLYDDDINVLRKLLQDRGEFTSDDEESIKTNLVDDTKAVESEALTGSTSLNQMLSMKGDMSCTASDPDFQLSSQSSDLQHLSMKKLSQYTDVDVEKIIMERDQLKARIRKGDASRTTIDERQELERQLHNTKSELFRVQRQSRNKIEDLLEKMDTMKASYEEQDSEKDAKVQALCREIDSLKGVPINLSECDYGNPNPDSKISFLNASNDKLLKQVKEMEDKLALNNRLLQKTSTTFEKKSAADDDTIIDLKRVLAELQNELDSEKMKNSGNEEDYVSNNEYLKKQVEKYVCHSKMLENKLFKKDELIKSLQTQLASTNSASPAESHVSSLQALNAAQEITIKELNNTVSHLQTQVSELNKESKQYQDEVYKQQHIMEKKQRDNEDYLIEKNGKLKNKLDLLQKELADALSSKISQAEKLDGLENEFKDQSVARESQLKEEISNLNSKVTSLENEIVVLITKSKSAYDEAEKKEAFIVRSILAQCQNLNDLCRSVDKSNCESFEIVGPQNLFTSCKAVEKLKETTTNVCDVVDEMCVHLEKLKKEAQRREKLLNIYQNSACSMEKLSSITDKKIADRVDGSMSPIIKSPSKVIIRDLSPDKSTSSNLESETHAAPLMKHNPALRHSYSDLSTVNLLSHLQGRVKQLREENILLQNNRFLYNRKINNS